MQQRYSFGAILLHWLLALALTFQLSLGMGLDYLGREGFAQYQLHKSVGIVILALSLLRLILRLFAPRPPKLERGWQGALAAAVHVGLYVFMLAAPLTGWLLVSTDKVRVPTLLFGTMPWPHLPAPHGLNGFAHVSHGVLGWIGLVLILLHIAGAVRHQWLLKDNLMARMAPARGLWLVLALAVPVGWALGIVAIKSGGQKAAPRPAVASMPPPTASMSPPAAVPATGNEAARITAAPSASPTRWTIRPGGTLSFSADNGGMRIDGRFAKWAGTIVFDPDHPEKADIRITVDLASASVGDPTQTQMLASADFLDVAAHPHTIYRATSARRTGPDRYAAEGTLALKGASRPQSLSFTLTGSGLKRHAEGRATIDRTAFSVGTGDNGKTLAPDVALTFSFDAEGQPPR